MHRPPNGPVPWVSFHTLRHTCAALLIAAGASPLRLQRWMGHHSPAYTLEAYGHLIDGNEDRRSTSTTS